MAADWYYSNNGQQTSPVTAADLKQLVRSGELPRSDMPWKEGMAQWTQAGQVKGLFDAAGKSQKIKASGECGGESVREIGFLSDDELLILHPKGFNFTWLFGRLKRVK